MIGEDQIPVMPMVHILSTHGVLVSFDLLNFGPGRVDICSPPQPISDYSGQSFFVEELPSVGGTPANVNDPNITFASPAFAATSTPQKSVPQKPANDVLAVNNKPAFGGMNAQPFADALKTSAFGGGASLFGAQSAAPKFGAFDSSNKPTQAAVPVSVPFGVAPQPAPVASIPFGVVPPVQAVVKQPAEPVKPFLTVAPQYTPPASQKSVSK